MKTQTIIALLFANAQAVNLSPKTLAQTQAEFTLDQSGNVVVENVGNDLGELMTCFGKDGVSWIDQDDADKKNLFKFLNKIESDGVAQQLETVQKVDTLSAQVTSENTAIQGSITQAVSDIKNGDYDLRKIYVFQNDMINALLDVLHENTDRLRYLSDRVDALSSAYGEGYVDSDAYAGHLVDYVLFEPDTA